MAYSDHRRDTVGLIIEKSAAGQRPVVYLREENGRLVETRRVTDLVRCEVIGFVNLGEHRGYKITVMTPDGTERIWGAWEYNKKQMGVQGASTVWIEHPSPGAVTKTVDERLANLISAVRSGASNPALIKRANRIADDIEDEHPAVANQLRRALNRKWESLGNRVDRLQAIRAQLQAPAEPETIEEPTRPSYPIPSYDWDDVPGYDDVRSKPTYEQLQAEVDRLKAKYETPCPGLARNAQGDVVSCGGFLGHPGECAEVW